jgi:hypothetical protein
VEGDGNRAERPSQLRNGRHGQQDANAGEQELVLVGVGQHQWGGQEGSRRAEMP